MDFFNAAADGRDVVLFLMPSAASQMTGSVRMTIDQALKLAVDLERSAKQAAHTPMNGGEAVREVTGTSPDQLRLRGML